MSTSNAQNTAVPEENTTATTKKAKTANTTHSGVSDKLMTQLKHEIENMLLFGLHNGKIINTDINSLVESDQLDDLINAHNLLAKNIAPATPKSVLYLKELYTEDKKESFFGRLPLIRNLIILSLVFLFGFIATSLSPYVNTTSLNEGILKNQGLPLLMNLLFLCSISGLGVVFYLLKSVSRSIQSGTLVSEDTIYYAALIILGIISGLILSEIVSLYNEGQSLSIFNNCVLALIGGFSSDAIFSILQEIIQKIKSVFTS